MAGSKFLIIGVLAASICWFYMSRSPTSIGSSSDVLCTSDRNFGYNVDNICTKNEARLIKTSSGIIDTNVQRPFQVPRDLQKCISSAHIRQFYVQTIQFLSGLRRQDLESELGFKFGRYVPNNAFIVNMNCSTALRAMKKRDIVWIARRPHRHKLDFSLTAQNFESYNISEVESWPVSIYASLIPTFGTQRNNAMGPNSSTTLDAAFLGESIRAGLAKQAGIQAQWRIASPAKLTFDVPAGRVAEAARWLARLPEIVWIEPKAAFSGRNSAAARIIASGTSDYSRQTQVVQTSLYGLNGSGQIIAVADTGIDWDHCMLWNPPFSFPCFDPAEHAIYAPGTTAPNIDCPASALAALFASKDYLAFVRMMSRAADQRLTVSLLDSGTTVGVVSGPPPLDAVFPNHTLRQELGLRFPPAGDATFDTLLAAWSDFRPRLLQTLQPVLLLALCADCGGQVVPQGGLDVFVPFHAYKYQWGLVDNTASLMLNQGSAEYQRFSARFFRKCMCFFATPSDVTVDPDKKWMGPVPPIIEMLDLAYSPYAQVTRKLNKLPALAPELLAGMCNVSRRNVSDADLCNFNVTYLWGDATLQLNPCELTWDPRLMEIAVASCISELYLPPTSLSPASVAQAPRLAINQLYVRNSTEAWWREYTRVPPFDRLDRSRRSVAAYYTLDGCSPCGACDRLLADSRAYAGAETVPPLPTQLPALGPALIRLRSSGRDWLLDGFQMRNTPMHMVVNVRVEFDLAGYAPALLQNLSRTSGLTVCVTTVQEVDPTVFITAAWLARCIQRTTLRPTLYNPVQEAAVVVRPLLPAADGWQVLLFHDEPVAVTVDSSAQLFASASACSDKQDGKTIIAQPTRANNLSGTNVACLAQTSPGPDGQCQARQATYCDNTYTSGRQLDLCRVCGGTCFGPNCSAALCPGVMQNGIAAIRYTAEFAQVGGVVNRTFTFDQRLGLAVSCLVTSMPGVDCRPIGCNLLGLCAGRVESYRVDTRGSTARAGSDFIFGPGALVYDPPSTIRQMLRLTVSLFRPGLMGSMANNYTASELGELRLPSPFLARLNGSNITSANASNFTIVNNVSVVSASRTSIRLVGLGEVMLPTLAGLIYRPAETAGTALDNRLVGISFELRILTPSGASYSQAAGRPSPYIASCKLAAVCQCYNGFKGAECDEMPNTKEIILTVQPFDPGRRVIPRSSPSPGRKGLINRGGHGTHITTSLAGVASTDFGAGEASDPTLQEVKGYESISNGAQIAFMDIGTDASPYLTPPESLGDALLGRIYSEAGARVFVAPWNCDAYQWWGRSLNFSVSSGNKSSTNASSTQFKTGSDGRLNDDSFETASNYNLSAQPSLCNRYTTSSWEIDEFVERNRDLLVVFPAGDNGDLGTNTISSPGTCKNCLTVGMSQLWAMSLQDSARYLLEGCLPDDCPQSVDNSQSCGGTNVTSPYTTPDCCIAKYTSDTYSPENVHYTSGRGLAVSMQSGRALYADLQPLQFGRIKPEVVSPGVLIVSGRSDGDPNSGGTNGCRCCTASADNDASCLVALTGTSMSAAQLGAAAVLVRQYFVDGWYPAGYPSGPGFSPSAALLRAVLITAANPILGAARPNGGRDDISTLRTPNLYAGFGRTTITNALRLVVPFNDVCPCTGDNTGLFNSDSDPNIQIFGRDYGTYCAPWNNMPDGRPQRCDSMFLGTQYSRPVPDGFNPSINDISCCLSFCFVSPSCSVLGSGTRNWTSFPGLTYSFATCKNQPTTLQACPWADSSQNQDVRTIVKDHVIFDAATATSTGTTLNWESTPTSVRFIPSNSPVSAAIAENETFYYNMTIFGASRSVPFVVSLAYTDPVAALGSATIIVNNLNLRVLVTPLSGQLGSNGSATISQAALLPRLNNQTSQYWGNGVSGGDLSNNVEQVRLTSAGPSQVIVYVVASRVAQGLGGGPLCQPFSLVWTGQLVEFPNPPLVSSIPKELQAGVCGRPAPLYLQSASGFSSLVLGLIVAGSVVGMAILVLACYVFRRARRKVAQAAGDNKARPDQMGYLTSLTQVLREEGIARGGALDHILLSFDSSADDDYYRGLPIAIVEGAAAGETTVITKYEGGASRKAYAAFAACAPEKGSHYVIGHQHGTALGYKVSSLGYAAPESPPQRRDGFGNQFYGQQMTALSHARATYGQLPPSELAKDGIGRADRARSIAQDLNALNAGMLVNRKFYSGDIFVGGLDKAEISYDPIKEAQKRVRQDYFNSVESRSQAEDAVQIGKRDKSFIPPLKSDTIASGFGKIRVADGYIFTPPSRGGKSRGVPEVEEELHV